MTIIPNSNSLEVARTIDSFLSLRPEDIAEAIKDAPLALRARIAVGLGEFVTIAQTEAGYLSNFSSRIEPMEKAIFDSMVPELKRVDPVIKKLLISEGSDMLRGGKLDSQSLRVA